MSKRIWLLFVAGVVVSALALADDDDPPSRAARLSYLSGTVSFQPGSVEDWVPATLNRPMTTGDRLWTEAGARAEMHIGSAALRLNGRTNFAFLNLDDRTVQAQMSLGTLSVRLRRLADDETFEIDTPQLALTLLRPGEYRVDVNEEGDTTVVSVRGGDAEANAGSQSFAIHAREQVRVTGADQPVFDRRDIPPADPFDNFCAARDRREDMSQSSRYVSRDIPGYEDLDDAGVWREEPQYGWIWTPRVVVVGWAPYRYGHWAWISPWGWTWVDDAPWGYAPFHYGRWVFAGGGWGWVPGPVVVRPVYAPAMVAWIGGPNFSVGIGVGAAPAVGWFPLGPREVWVPSYRYSPAYIERVNVTNTVIVNRTVINNINVNNVTYVNRNVTNAVTVMPQNQMVAGRPVAAAAIRANADVVARAQVQTTAAAAPQQAAVLGGRAPVSAAPPASVMSRQVVARQTPPPPAPSFAQQRQELQQNPGQPIPRGRLSQIQAAPAAPGAAPPPRPSFRQVGPPRGQPAQAPPPVQAAPAPQPAPIPQVRPRVEQPAPQPQPAPTPRARPEIQRPRVEQPEVAPRPQPRVQPAPPPQPAPQAQPAPQPERRGRPEPPPAAPAPAPAPQVQPERRNTPAPESTAPQRGRGKQEQRGKEQDRREKSDDKGR